MAYNVHGQFVNEGQGYSGNAFGVYFNHNGTTIGTQPGGAVGQINAYNPNTSFTNQYYYTLNYTDFISIYSLTVLSIFLVMLFLRN